MKYFNTEGPINNKKHYYLDPLKRLDLFEIETLIDREKYFVLHAPRQTGKTTSMLALMKYLNKQNKYKCLYFNVESAQALRENIELGIKTIIERLARFEQIYLKENFFEKELLKINSGYGAALANLLSKWAEQSKKPIVLIFDEIDSLVGDTLISVLRQLRSGYADRPEYFPQSVILCGVRDIRDYRIHSSIEKQIITGGSCFNIKAESLRLGDFSKIDVFNLINEHEKETAQKFTQNAKEKVYYYSNGQPWLVNAICYEVCFKMKPAKYRNITITCEMIDDAKENLILRKDTHLDQLTDKLREERVRSVIEPLLVSSSKLQVINEDDLQYVVDIGLIKRKPNVSISNPIYQEIIPRALIAATQDMMLQNTFWYQNKDGSLNMDKLLTAFQDFFAEQSQSWLERFDYKEAGPQLLMQAFLQRIINSGGRVEREYGLGTMRTDLLVIWFYGNKKNKEKQKIIIELKLLYKSFKATLEQGLKQTFEYMDKCLTNEGHLIIFDKDPQKTWKEKIFKLKKEYNGKKIMVWGA
ncbi:MAG: hypothetical protein B6I26_06185 [Desulfobacteraceae bacterium 4572_130]|nr:MAG: hypothetical protein B6I26_06185 [Desulfobacteraceae bacterium 4572_130]